MGTLIPAVLIGLLAGTHTATWGMYKDSPHEGFSPVRYLRSPLVGAAAALAVWRPVGLDLAEPAGLVVFFGLVYVLERGTVEFYKGFVREEDQSKYFIPMQFAVLGKPLQSRRKRLLVGAVYAAAVGGVLFGVVLAERLRTGIPPLLLVALLGSVGGWVSAFGGAWKDAPVEGFELFKFFRSPLVAAAFAVLLAHLTSSLLLVTLAALGYTIATIETYKTFFFPSRPRGKFAGKPVLHPQMLRKRRRFVPVYALIWMVLAGAFVGAFLGPREGLLALF